MASLKQVRPNVSHRKVCILASSLFGLKDIKVIKELESYEDRNFQIRALHKRSDEREDFVFKILCSKCTYHSDFAKGKALYMQALQRRSNEIVIQETIPTLSGELNAKVLLELPDDIVNEIGKSKLLETDDEFLVINEEDNKLYFNHFVRLTTYIKGDLLSSYEMKRNTLLDIGEITANFQRISMNLDIPELDGYEMVWDLRCLPLVRNVKLQSIADADKKAMATSVIDRFETEIIPILDQLPRQFIHGDLNEANILVLPNSGKETKTKYGVIDFGDCSYSCRIFELAISIAYMLLEADIQQTGLSHVEVSTAVMEGYLNGNGLIDAVELNSLHLLIAGRLCQSLVIGYYQMTQVDPDNIYLANTSRNGWRVLQDLLDLTEKPFLNEWNKLLMRT